MSPTLLKVDQNSTDEQMLSYVAQQVNLRYRFLETDTVLPPPTLIQIELCVEDALAEINSQPPQTHFDLKGCLLSKDRRWKALLIVGTAKEVLKLRVVEWGANGYDSPIEDLPIESKLADYQSLLDAIGEDFRRRLEALKEASQKATLRARTPHANPIQTMSFSISGRYYGRF